MTLRIVRFISLLCAALATGMVWCHLLELLGKMTLSASVYLIVQALLYRGWAVYGAILEPGALLSTVIVLFLVHGRRRAFRWTLLALVCLIAMLGVFFVFTAPVNRELDQWTVATLPDNWAQLRNQWEYSHAAHAVLGLLGFCALLIAVLVDTPETPSSP